MLFTNRYILPGFGITFGSSVLFICLILLLPLTGLIMQLSKISFLEYWNIITDPALLVSYKITLLSAGLATLFNVFFGMLIAWILVRYRFPGQIFLDGLVDLPFALPTAVAGLTLSTLFSRSGWYGSVLIHFGIEISYTWLGIALAMSFTSLPFVIRAVQPVLERISPVYEEVAKTLGATRWQIFYNIILPELFPALLSGTVLSFIRSLGEFGAVIFIAGNIAGKSEVLSLIIFIKLQEFDYPAASAIASVILGISLLLFFIINFLQFNVESRIKGN